jgi:hypothetical protein
LFDFSVSTSDHSLCEDYAPTGDNFMQTERKIYCGGDDRLALEVPLADRGGLAYNRMRIGAG